MKSKNLRSITEGRRGGSGEETREKWYKKRTAEAEDRIKINS